MSEQPKIVAFGGGMNSTAMLIGMWQRNIRPDLILFADTGGELPETYQHVAEFNNWLLGRHYPEIITVKKTYRGEPETLEENCLRMKMLPGIAYGYKNCSGKFKRDPQDKYCNNWQPARDCWKAGEKCIKYIGYDAGEERRAKIADDNKYTYAYPLIEWGWHREECQRACLDEGFDPPKSACFYCPNNKKHEILTLQRRHPDLLKRALEMEAQAQLTTIKGLGRNYSWADFLKAENSQKQMFCDLQKDMPCGCYDGEESPSTLNPA